MRPRERVIRALELEEPDTVPTFEMVIDPTDTVRAILGREPIYENPKRLLEMQWHRSMTEGEIERVNGQYIRDQYELYAKLDLDMIRFWEWRFRLAKSVEKVSEEEWVIDGARHVFKGGTLWSRAPVDGVVSRGPSAVVDWLDENAKGMIEAVRGAQYPSLRYMRELNEGEKFILFDAGCIWGVEEITSFEEFPLYLPCTIAIPMWSRGCMASWPTS